MTDCPFQPFPNQVRLPAASPADGNTTPFWASADELTVVVPQAVAAGTRPRIIDILSDAPCDLWLRWYGSGGNGSTAWFTTSRGGRISVNARSLEVRAWNRAPVVNTVSVSAGHGRQDTRNSWAVETYGGDPLGAIPVPPFAERVMWVSGDASTGARLELQNSWGTVIGRAPQAQAISVSGARSVEVHGLAATEVVTVLFELGL